MVGFPNIINEAESHFDGAASQVVCKPNAENTPEGQLVKNEANTEALMTRYPNASPNQN